jgi:hypothetical protein
MFGQLRLENVGALSPLQLASKMPAFCGSQQVQAKKMEDAKKF